MAETTVPHWAIGAALALFGTAVAAEPMGEATHNVGTVGGRERTFIEYVPKTLKPGAPLLFVLHPSGGDASGMRDYSKYEFDELADKHGFLVVYPDGFENTWNDCRGGSPFSSKRLKIDDSSFIEALLNHEVTVHAIDRKRVFAAGWSNGAQLAYRLALEHPEDFAGVATISASLPMKENLDCGQVDKPIPVMIVNGTADPINPYRGGMVNLGGAKLGNVLSSEDTAKYWAKLLGVTAMPELAKLPHKGGSTSVDSMT
jgi:polyhydroxybutyrate depolymerase